MEKKEKAEWVIKVIGKDVASLYPVVACSVCGQYTAFGKTPYCPYCGRKMTNALCEEVKDEQ